MKTRLQTKITPLCAAVAALILAGCSSLNPEPLANNAALDRAATDRVTMFNQQEPIAAPLTLDEAIARAIKYNLDLRLKKMEVAVNGQLHEVSKFDMLPNLVAGAGYASRSNFSGGTSRLFSSQTQGATPDQAGAPSNNFSTSADMSHRLASVEFSWNVLDFGVSYYRAKQRADEFLIAQERKRRVIQTIVHDVRFAYWRALAAQRLAGEVEDVMQQAQKAIDQSRAAESAGALPVQAALAYQRSLVDAVALLNTRRQELEFAKAELAALMSAPTSQFTLVDTSEPKLQPLPSNVAILEDTALANRPELREEDYRKRISGNETRRQLMQAFPNLTLGLGTQYDSNSLLYNNDWVEGSARLSWNLLRVLSMPAVQKAGDRQLEVDDARRQALSMAVITQTRIAAMRYGLAKADLDLAQKSLDVDSRVASVAQSGVNTKAESQLELVRAKARATLAKYQRAIAFANAAAAYARIQHSLGQEFDLGDVEPLSVGELAKQVGTSLAKAETQLPVEAMVKAGPQPKVRVYMEDDAPVKPEVQAMVPGVIQALQRGGFQVVYDDQPGTLALKLGLELKAGDKGLNHGQVRLSKVGEDARVYDVMLPQQPGANVWQATGEAAVNASVGHLRGWFAQTAR